jgi:LAO/AO transport system kinase
MTAITRSARTKRPPYKPSMDLVAQVLERSRLAVARMISRAESGQPEAVEALAEIYRHSGKAHIIGITGVPGAGKSTLVSSLIRALTNKGHKVGVVAIDPSSPFSGGAILGDRVRMSDAVEANEAFVRSMATRGHLGGLSRATLQAVDILDAAGYSPIIIETVGVGQDEVEIVTAAHSVVVLSPPGLGDDIQAIKAGILEIADIHVVSKADRSDAPATIAALKGMMALGAGRPNSSWSAPILGVSSLSGQNMDELVETLATHLAHLKDSGELVARQRNMCRTRILGTAKHLFQQQFNDGNENLERQLQGVIDRNVDPQAAALVLLGWNKEGKEA